MRCRPGRRGHASFRNLYPLVPSRLQSADAPAAAAGIPAPLSPVLSPRRDKQLERRKAERLLAGQIQVLEAISRGEPLDRSLSMLARVIESQSDDLVCSVLLMDADGRHVRHGAAPSLPAGFTLVVDGAAIGPAAGSCGTAAYRRAPVIVEDIAVDPLWAEWRAHVLPLGLRACWSTPIFDDKQDLLGTFAIYYRNVGPPPEDHRRLVESATHLAGIAISREREHAARKRHEDEIERLNRLYAALSHVNQLLVRTQSSTELFTNVTRIIVEQGGFAMAWIGWLNEGAIEPIAHFGGEGYVEHLRLSVRADDAHGRGPTGIAFRENRTYVCNDFATDPAAAVWREGARRRGFAASAVFPIRRLGSPRGVLAVYAARPGAFLEREVALLEEAAADIAFALEHLDEEEQRRNAERSLRESESRLRSLAMRLENIREQERTAIAREIHDVLAQELTRLKIDLVWMAKRAAKLTAADAAGLAERIADATRQTDTAITTVQRIATELRPVILDSLGLAAAIEWQVEDFGRRTGTRGHASVPREELKIAREPATALFRILQEGLTNVARHAAATEVHVELVCTEYAFRLTIQDDGRGVRREEIEDPRSIGLVGMRERAQAFGGGFCIRALPTRGTLVEVFIPSPA